MINCLFAKKSFILHSLLVLADFSFIRNFTCDFWQNIHNTQAICSCFILFFRHLSLPTDKIVLEGQSDQKRMQWLKFTKKPTKVPILTSLKRFYFLHRILICIVGNLVLDMNRLRNMGAQFPIVTPQTIILC